MIKSILVTLDGSESSKTALRVAVGLADITQSDLKGLFVVNQERFMSVPVSSVLVATVTGQAPIPMLRSAQEVIQVEEKVSLEGDEIETDFKEACKTARVDCKFISELGDPDEIIAHYARTVDLVVMGNSGKHEGLSFPYKGQTISGLLHLVTRPILIVPEVDQGGASIVIAYDGSPPAERALRLGAEFSQIMQISEVHLLTVIEDSQEETKIQSPAIQYLRNYDLDVREAIVRGDAGEVIDEYVSRVEPAMLVMGAYGAGALAETIYGSTTDFLLGRAQCALLTTS